MRRSAGPGGMTRQVLRPLFSSVKIVHFVIAITAVERRLRHLARRQTASATASAVLMSGRTAMRNISLFVVAAAAIGTGFGVWAASPTNAGAPSMGQTIEPFQLILNANNLPTTVFADYTFVFR